jgi:hypothetical protein
MEGEKWLYWTRERHKGSRCWCVFLDPAMPVGAGLPGTSQGEEAAAARLDWHWVR